MLRRVVGTLSDSDLRSWQEICVQYQALHLNPIWYTRKEAEEILRRHNRIVQEFMRRYELDHSKDYEFYSSDGAIVEEEVT